MLFDIFIKFSKHNIYCCSIVVSTSIIKILLKTRYFELTKELKDASLQNKITIDIQVLKSNIDKTIFAIKLNLDVAFASRDNVAIVLIEKSNL